MNSFIVIGITDHPSPFFPPEVLEVIQQGSIFSGGKRHHEIVAPFLPDGARWIDITVPLSAVFEQYQPSPINNTPSTIIVFASGDPLFFGFANTLRSQFPSAHITVFPTFNSLQLLAHRLLLPYHDLRIVSLTGRPWQELDRALIEGAPKIGVLTDKEHTPATIAQRMLHYGFGHYHTHVGEHLGNPALERVSSCTLEEAAQHTFQHPNCLILTGNHQRRWGLPDSEFALLNGREKMITKMPIRLLTLQALDLPNRHTLWDIGACTGSVSIEAHLQFPHLHIHAFEIRPECEAIIHENARRFHAPGLHLHMGDFMQADITSLPRPDAVFIGGHGGHLKEIMAMAKTVLTDNGIIVFNSVIAPKVSTDSHQLWNEACEELQLKQDTPTQIQLNNHHPITILRCKK